MFILQSGHIIYKEYANTGDGELTSIKILETLKKENKSLAELTSIMKKYPQVLVNINIDNKIKNDFYTDDIISNEITKLTNTLGTEGRVLVRPSGTEPLIRIMIEGKNEKEIEKHANKLAQIIKERLT